MATPGPEVTALMKRGKRNTASYYKGECFRKGGSNQSLNNLLDSLFDPRSKSIDDVDTIDWCRWLIAGGSTFDEFTKTVKQYDNAIICGLVWTANFVAYRCRTCGISPCMSLCAECFQAGQHEGHDYNMFRSKAGGACDCGDVSVMNKDGFCSRHGPNRGKQHSTPPPDLMAIAEAMLPRVVLRLIHHLRDTSNIDMQGTYSLAMQDAEQYLTFLHSLSDMGAAMRKVMGHALTNPDIYKTFTEVTNPEEETNTYKVESQKKFKTTVENMKYPKVFDDYIGMLAGMPGLTQTLNHKTLLEELVFWMVKFEFPQRMVTLLLSLLPDDDYKEAFTRAFIDHYSRISLVLVNGLSRPAIANRVVHISVQLFSNENLAKKMVEEYNLLYTLILSLTHMVENIVTQSTLQDSQMNMHMVVDCDNDVMKDHCYWPVVSDLINLLSHQTIAHKFLGDLRLINMWLELLCYFQGMNLNQRELSQHMGFEPETYYAAFSAELEIASSPMWSLMSHCKTKETAHFTKSMVSVCLENLREWFDAINCMESTKPNPYQLTFHLPLHRYLAIFLVHGVQCQDIPITEFDLAPKRMKTILHHLLQIQVSVSEVYANMWIRNGLQIRGQAMTYVQCHFCYSMVDADLCLQQVCACKLDPDYFVQTVLERYHVRDWLSYSNHPNTDPSFKLEPEQQLAMVDAALSYLVTLLGVRTYLGIDEKDLVRLEMSTLLCVSDRQHSQLTDLMPEKSGMIGHGTELFEPTLKELADYKAPNFEAGAGLQQGTYVPKDFIWEQEFDPVHVALRAVSKKDFQSSMDRYSAFVRQNGKYSGKTPPWPPFKPPGEVNPAYKDMFKILHCRTLHAFLFTVLHKALTKNTVPESCLYHCIHLLNLALTIPSTDTHRRSKVFRGCAPNGDYKDWFTSTSLLQNACDTIKEVHVSVLSLEPGDNFTFPADVDLVNSSLEEMFQMAPSSIMSSGGPITAAHSGHIPSHPTLLPMPSEGTFPVLPIHSLSSHSGAKTNDNKPKYESKGVSTETAPPVTIPINESLISLLMKLHCKLSGKAGSYVPLSMCNRLPSTSRVGDGSHFITCLLDKMSQQSSQCAKLIEETYQQLVPKTEEGGKQKSGKKDDRKKKAKERQEKLMAQFASKQKAFMEQNFDTDPPDDSSSTTSEKLDTKQVIEEKEFDCVICGHSSPSTADKPIGLVVLIQASSVLGHRLQTEDPIHLPVEGEKVVTTPISCELAQKRQLKALFEHFEETSCQMSVNIGWEGGVVVQTCGHYLHLDCHSSYVASLTTQEVNQNLLVSKGEYWCPLCRQLANSVIPIIPEESKYTLVKPVSPVLTKMVKDIAEMMIRRPITPRSSTLTKAMGSVMEDLTNVTYSVYKTYTTSQSSESVLLFVCSVARSNLEIELLQRGGDLCPATSVGRKQSFLPLTHVLSMHSKILTTKPYTDLWSHITGVTCSEESSSVLPYNKEVPVLLKDPSSLLIQLILTLPATIEKEHFILLTKMLYNVVFIQALACTSCKFTMDEREAWRKKGRKVSFDSLEGILSQVITRLEVSRLYEDVDMQDVGIPAICQSVWSPHCVDMAVQDFCLPFLKIAALVRHHMFEQEFPEKAPNTTEFQETCQFLGLNKIGTTITPPHLVSSSSIVHWLVPEPLTLVRAWCTDLTNFINTHPSDAKSLLLKNPTWYPPQLIALPQHYYKIFQAYNNATCSICSNVPKDPALCMVCGRFLCFRQACCQQQRIYECVRHSIECGAGTAMFLLVNSSVVVVIRGPRATLWGCVYLDEHGEEDRDLKRGKPLFLSKERYNLLQHQWISHNFDHSCKRWIWHQDRL
ncbi:E3 ubiquitin-protein ligase ubr3-like [Argopecten irradians]|uniref:E3 ubiquitin-protein ligase ubr3-like n=1 Tax=Argopecten irradians TaxID=31199 RepID=UPI00372287FA